MPFDLVIEMAFQRKRKMSMTTITLLTKYAAYRPFCSTI